MDDEFAFPVDTRIDELLAQGLSPKDAREEALRGLDENLLISLRDGSRNSLRAGGRDTLRGVLVVGEVRDHGD